MYQSWLALLPGFEWISWHSFLIGLAALGVGLIFRLAAASEWLKAALTVVPFAAIVADIFARFLTKRDPFHFFTVVISGALPGFAWAGQILVSLYQLWFLRVPEPTDSSS